uniref:Uncharacterized protein n=1 Tax=viral metagenome TaxID=1070528 RepID=A0A6M3KD74_9ZZZZ
MQTYYVTVCREYGTVQEEAVLKSDHLAALEAEMKEKDKWYAEQWKCQEADRDKKDVEMGKQIATLKANAEFLSSELERLRSRIVLTPAESHLTMPAALKKGEEG